MLYLLTALAFAADADGDGFADSVDCDDSNASVYPGAVESCDGLDTDCDGVTPQTEQDQDGDGYVACGAGWSDCSDYVATDTANAVWESTWRLVDSLGVMVDPAGNAVVGGCDCRDESGGELTSPGVVETCGVTPLEDNDCDGDFYTAKGVPVSGPNRYFKDYDGDGYGTPTDWGYFCYPLGAYVWNDLDCDDGNPDRNPLADEICNAVDDDCDGLIDNEDYGDLGDSSGCIDLFRDADLDGYGSDQGVQCICPNGEFSPGEDQIMELEGVRFTSVRGDCEDTQESVYPGAPEALTGFDEDCNGWLALAEADCDYDGYRAFEPTEPCTGEVAVRCWDRSTTAVCEPESGLLYIEVGPQGHSGNEPGDCDDLESTTHPGAPEKLGDGVDQDCDGEDAALEETGDSGIGETGDTGPVETEMKGCNCSSQSGSLAGLWGMALVGLFWRRRRRRT